MRGVDLNVFTFDYDLTWAGFFLNADEFIYGRFGGRDAASAEKYLTLPGLKYAMRQALAAHQRAPHQKPEPRLPKKTVEQYPAARRLRPNACIHCHQAYDFRREDLQAKKEWSLDEAWVYPLPETVGLTLDVNQGNRVAAVAADSSAAQLGIKPGDVLQTVGTLPVASFADVQHALHLAPRVGKLTVAWQRGDTTQRGDLELPAGWRKTDISWRESMWGLDPAPGVFGAELADADKKKLGLSVKALAFRQGTYVPPQALAAGIQAGDIIIGIDDKKLEMSMRKFNAHVRLTYKVGDRVTLNIIRDGKRHDIPMTLEKRPN